MGLPAAFHSGVRAIIDYALPPRCPACGEIVDIQGSFCTPCWEKIDFLNGPVCATCGETISETSAAASLCGPCLATPPLFKRARAATVYGDITRALAHRLKYGRRMGHARIMATHMARLLPSEEGEGALLLVPVPLHRWRIWRRGFNQAALIAQALSERSGVAVDADALRRTRNTPPLHKQNRKQRERTVAGAFAMAPAASERVRGRHVVVIDDIWTTGATARGCAAILKNAGAARVDILCWTRAPSPTVHSHQPN